MPVLAALVSLLLPALAIAAPEGADTAEGERAVPDTGDWPQILGPRRDGVSRMPGLLDSWPENGPKELWRRSIGDGFSGVAARGDRLVTMDARDGQEGVHCLDAATGETLWRTPLSPTFENSFGNGPRSTPAITPRPDGAAVAAVTSDMRLAVLSLADGSIRWSRSLADDFGVSTPRFGYSSSPLWIGDLLVVDVGAVDDETPGPSIMAFDAKDGTVRWQALEGRTDYSAPVLAELGGIPQIVLARGSGPEVVSLALDGTELWRHPGPPGVIAMPVVVPPNRLFVSSSDDTYGGHLLEVIHGSKGFEVSEVWDNRRMRNHISTSVLVDGHLYGFDNATFQCLDAANGERRWAVRGFGKGSVVAGGGLLYILGDDGILALAEATPDAYTELGRLQAMTGKSWTVPTLAHGRLVLRDHDEMVVFDIRRQEGMPSDHPSPSTAQEANTAASAERAGPTTADGAATELETLLARYAAARGGLARWRKLRALAFEGTYSTFSTPARFEELRLRAEPGGGHFRLELEMLGFEVVRARDAEGPWMLHPIVEAAEPIRIDPEGDYAPYHALVEREALFEPPLLDPAAHGARVELLGSDKIAERPTIALRLTYDEAPEALREEIWHLDPRTHLEVAVVGTTCDFSLTEEPMEQRIFYSDFQSFDGIVLPLHRELEFGTRLEVVTLEKVTLDPEVDPGIVGLERVLKTSPSD